MKRKIDDMLYSVDYRQSLVNTVNLAIDRLFDNVYRELKANKYLAPRNLETFIIDENCIRHTLVILGITSDEMKQIDSRSYYKLLTVYDWLHEND